MKCSGGAQNQNPNRSYGRCDICEIGYGSEMASIQHMLSLKHHKRYEAVQRSLGNPVSHFCPVCGIGGIRDISEWADHVRSTQHSSSFGQYMQPLNAQKTAMMRQKNEKSVYTSSVDESVGEPETSLPSYSSEKFRCAKSIDRGANCCWRSMTDGGGPCCLANEHCPHRGSRLNCYRFSPADCRRSQCYPASHSSRDLPPGVYWNHSSHQRTNNCDYNKRDYYQNRCFISQSRAHYSRRSVMLESERDSVLKLGFGQSDREKAAMMKSQVSGKWLVHQSPDSQTSVPQESMHQETSQQSILTEEVPSTEHSEPVLVDPSTKPTSSVLPLSCAVKKTHEVSELSEALNKLRQQQCTLTRYIRQLKYIRQQKGKEKRLLRKRRSALLREMNLSDSQAETGSSDEFNDDAADGSGLIEASVKEDGSENLISTCDSNSNVGEARDQGRFACRASLSSVTGVALGDSTSSVTAVATVPLISRLPEGGFRTFTSDGRPQRWARKHSSRSGQMHQLSTAAITVDDFNPSSPSAISEQPPVKYPTPLRRGRRPRRKNRRNGVVANLSSGRITSERRTRTPTSFSVKKRRELSQTLARPKVKSASSQQVCDAGATEAVPASAPESRVDPARLRWVRQLLSHPQSRVYTFAELDKLVIDLVNSVSSSSGF